MRVNSLQGDLLDYSHILIKINDRNANPQKALERLKVVRDSVMAKQVTFEALAKRHSEDPQSAPLGGAILNMESGARNVALTELQPRWRITLNKLKVGDISEPTETELRDGRKAWHIVWLQKRTPAHRINLQDDYAQIEQLALNEKKGRLMRDWIDRLRQDVYIQTFSGESKVN